MNRLVDNPAAGAAARRDQEVLAALRAGQANAAELLVEVFGDRLYGLALRLTGSVEDAEEVVQESFLTVWNKWPGFREEALFSSWVYRIAANHAYRKLRGRRHAGQQLSFDRLGEAGEAPNPESQLLASALIVKADSPADTLRQREFLELFQQSLDSLSPMYRSAYMLKEIDGMAVKDIADVLGISLGAVKTRVHRARLQLREKLGRLLRH